MPGSAKSGKSQKIDRNRKWCQAYRNRDQRGRNKVKKLLRHFKRYGYAARDAVNRYNNLPAHFKPAANRAAIVATARKGKGIKPREPMPPVRRKVSGMM